MSVEELIQLMRTLSLAQIRAQLEIEKALEARGTSGRFDILAKFYQAASTRKK